MKERKRVILGIIMGVLICCSGFFFILVRYFFFNKYNIHAKRAAMERLNVLYDQEFELVSINYEPKEAIMTDGLRYIYLWKFTFQDKNSRKCCVYVWLYGNRKWGEGMFYDPDYSNNKDDTYAQVRIEELLGEQYDLYKYRQEKESRIPDKKDYIFVCTPEQIEKTAEMLTEIFFTELEFSIGGCLSCQVNNEAGEPIFSYQQKTISSKLLNQQDKAITEENVYTYILQELQDGMKTKS